MKRVFLIFMVFYACSNEPPNRNDAKTINIDISQSIRFFAAEELLDTTGHEIILLDTINSTFIGHIDKLLVEGDKIFIWDRDNKAIFIYESTGKYLSKVASPGRAKNEYIDISDFYVSEDRLYILDNISMKLLEYDLTGKHMKTLDISMYWANSLFVMNDRIYLINDASNTDNGQYHIFKIDTNGNLQDKYLKFDKRYMHAPDTKAYSRMDNVFSVCIGPNSIYRVDSASCQPLYYIDFTNKNLPEKYQEQDLRILLKEGIASQYIVGIDQIQESAHYLFIYFWDNWKYYTALYNKIKDSVTVCEGIGVNSIYKIGLGNYHVCDNCIYDVVEANLFKILVAERREKNAESKNKYTAEVEETDRKITDDNNPIIIKYRLKS